MNRFSMQQKFIDQVRDSELLYFLVSQENESLSFLVSTLLEQGYIPSEISHALKAYIERSVV